MMLKICLDFLKVFKHTSFSFRLEVDISISDPFQRGIWQLVSIYVDSVTIESSPLSKVWLLSLNLFPGGSKLGICNILLWLMVVFEANCLQMRYSCISITLFLADILLFHIFPVL